MGCEKWEIVRLVFFMNYEQIEIRGKGVSE